MPRDGASIRGRASATAVKLRWCVVTPARYIRWLASIVGGLFLFSIWGSQKVMSKRPTHQPAPAQSSLPNVSSMEKPLASALSTLAASRPKRQNRRGRELGAEDKAHYAKIVVALKETIRLMAEIDKSIPAWPID